eukprot:5948794-Pleurochrysis_carterae.AAC.3
MLNYWLSPSLQFSLSANSAVPLFTAQSDRALRAARSGQRRPSFGYQQSLVKGSSEGAGLAHLRDEFDAGARRMRAGGLQPEAEPERSTST